MSKQNSVYVPQIFADHWHFLSAKVNMTPWCKLLECSQIFVRRAKNIVAHSTHKFGRFPPAAAGRKMMREWNGK